MMKTTEKNVVIEKLYSEIIEIHDKSVKLPKLATHSDSKSLNLGRWPHELDPSLRPNWQGKQL